MPDALLPMAIAPVPLAWPPPMAVAPGPPMALDAVPKAVPACDETVVPLPTARPSRPEQFATAVNEPVAPMAMQPVPVLLTLPMPKPWLLPVIVGCPKA